MARAVPTTRTRNMTDGEIAYLTMVLVLFVAFIIVVGTLSQSQKKRGK